jgi:hypothetical protein
MTHLNRVRVTWSNKSGLPGVSTFYFLDTATCVQSLHDFFDSFKEDLVAGTILHIDSVGDVIEDSTGVVTGSWSTQPVPDVNGTGAGAYAAPAGGVVSWKSATILDGRRLRGRTFLVPMPQSRFGDDGKILPAEVVKITAAAEALIVAQDSSFVVWHRPFDGRTAEAPSPSHPKGIKAKAAHAGGSGLVVGSMMTGAAAVLRSRRD